MITQIQEITEVQVQKNQEIDFGEITDEVEEAIGRLQKLIDDYNNWERYWCDGECSYDEYEEASTKRIQKLRKIAIGLVADSKAYNLIARN